MVAIDVVDDDADIPAAQPDPIQVSEESLIGHVAPEPGRQGSGSFSDGDGSGVLQPAADSIDARGLGVDAPVSDSVDSAGAIGVGADPAGLWAANSVGEGAAAEIPLTQAYADAGVAEAEPLPDMPALEADPFADLPALEPWADEDPEPPSVASASVVCSEAESSASTAAPGRTDIPCVTYFPTFSSELVARCQKCGRAVDPLKTRQARQENGKLPGGLF